MLFNTQSIPPRRASASIDRRKSKLHAHMSVSPDTASRMCISSAERQLIHVQPHFTPDHHSLP